MNNTFPTNELNHDTTITYGTGTDLMKKMPWSLALATIPFIPDILETIRSIPDRIARNGYAFQVKHGQTEVHFNRADIVGNSMEEDEDYDQND